VDGDLNGGAAADAFRIKIWDRANVTVVCDNQLGADDYGDVATAISGGSLVYTRGEAQFSNARLPTFRVTCKCLSTCETSLQGVKALKVVQTEVDPGIHGRLRHIADRRRVPLKAVIREALRTYVERTEGSLEEDPAFAMIGCWNLKGKDWSERKDWRP